MTSVVENVARSYLMDRPVAKGQTVQCGWFIFRVASLEPELQLETLNFEDIATYTTDFTLVDVIHYRQREVLERQATNEEPCTLQQAALVSRSYSPDRKDAFLKRDDPARGNISGWHVGVEKEGLDMNDRESFVHKSLYELSIHDRRMFPFWLLPVGATVLLESGRVTPSSDRQPSKIE